MIKLSPEAQLWITINAILITVIIILVIRLIKRRSPRPSYHPVRIPPKWVSIFDQLLRSEGPSRAITRTFIMILEDLSGRIGLSLKESLTSREALKIISSRLPREVEHCLSKLYNIYEPIRFGGKDVEVHNVEEFRKTLTILESRIRDLGGEA